MDFNSPPSWSPSAARELVDQACETVGVEFTSLRLLRFGMNAVYRLDPVGLVLRIARPGVGAAEIGREMALARYLDTNGFPTVVPADEIIDRPLTAAGATASFWHWVDHDGRADAQPAAFAHLLAAFHDITNTYPGRVPPLDPFKYINSELDRIGATDLLSLDDLMVLRGWSGRLSTQLASFRTVLGEGLCHGDAHTGNALVVHDGLVLIDYERLGFGPREWDLVPMALGPRRFGADISRYESFARAYGYDVRTHPHYEALVKTRELGSTTWRLALDVASGASAESERRMRYWHGEKDAPSWHAF